MSSPSSSKTAKFIWHEAKEGMALLSDNGIVRNVNPAFCEVLGYTDNELQGMHISEITHTEDQETDTIKFKELVSGKIKSYSMIKRWRSKFGKEVIGEVYARKWHDSVLIYLSLMPWCPSDTSARNIMNLDEKDRIMNDFLLKFLASLPAKAIKSKKFWTYIFGTLASVGTIIEYLRDFKDITG